MIKPFEINLDEATRIYNALKAAGCRFSDSWSPEKHQLAIARGRKSDEFITVMNPTAEQRKLLEKFGFGGASDKAWPGLCVQKHGLWPGDIHEMAGEQQRREMDQTWIDMGGFIN